MRDETIVHLTDCIHRISLIFGRGEIVTAWGDAVSVCSHLVWREVTTGRSNPSISGKQSIKFTPVLTTVSKVVAETLICGDSRADGRD